MHQAHQARERERQNWTPQSSDDEEEIVPEHGELATHHALRAGRTGRERESESSAGQLFSLILLLLLLVVTQFPLLTIIPNLSLIFKFSSGRSQHCTVVNAKILDVVHFSSWIEGYDIELDLKWPCVNSDLSKNSRNFIVNTAPTSKSGWCYGSSLVNGFKLTDPIPITGDDVHFFKGQGSLSGGKLRLSEVQSLIPKLEEYGTECFTEGSGSEIQSNGGMHLNNVLINRARLKLDVFQLFFYSLLNLPICYMCCMCCCSSKKKTNSESGKILPSY